MKISRDMQTAIKAVYLYYKNGGDEKTLVHLTAVQAAMYKDLDNDIADCINIYSDLVCGRDAPNSNVGYQHPSVVALFLRRDSMGKEAFIKYINSFIA